MQFKQREMDEKTRMVQVKDKTIRKPVRVEISQAEYDILQNIFNQATGLIDHRIYSITILGDLPDHTDTRDATLGLEVV